MREKRSYERHGLARGETLKTFQVCDSTFRNPYTRIAPEWGTVADFTRGVIAGIGLRPDGNELGRWMLVPVPDYLDLSLGAGDDFDREEWFFGDGATIPPRRMWDCLPDAVKQGLVFRPGYIEWQWTPFKRKLKVKKTSQLPEVFTRGSWPRSDDTERKRAKCDERRAERKRREDERVSVEHLALPVTDN